MDTCPPVRSGSPRASSRWCSDSRSPRVSSFVSTPPNRQPRGHPPGRRGSLEEILQRGAHFKRVPRRIARRPAHTIAGHVCEVRASIRTYLVPRVRRQTQTARAWVVDMFSSVSYRGVLHTTCSACASGSNAPPWSITTATFLCRACDGVAKASSGPARGRVGTRGTMLFLLHAWR